MCVCMGMFVCMYMCVCVRKMQCRYTLKMRGVLLLMTLGTGGIRRKCMRMRTRVFVCVCVRVCMQATFVAQEEAGNGAR